MRTPIAVSLLLGAGPVWLHPRPLTLLPLFAALVACGGKAPASGPSSGSFYIISDAPTAGSTAGASYERRVTFAESTCATSQVGPCTVNPCIAPASSTDGGAPGDVVPNAGTVTFSGAEMTLLALHPQSDGAYSKNVVDGQVPWKTGGETVTIQWAHAPGDTTVAGGSLTLGTPPYLALTPGTLFATAPGPLTRSRDLTLSWTTDTAAAVADQVLIDVTVGTTQIACKLDASAGGGVIPTAALALLPAGEGTYDVHSKEYASQKMTSADGVAWTLEFNIDARARTSYGTAKGPVTIQ
jgi:hypothetical protein